MALSCRKWAFTNGQSSANHVSVLCAAVHTAPHAAQTDLGTRADVAYRALKALVLRGEFPLNVRLVESRLATMLDVSRTPVREALRRLSGEGLLEAHPEGGFRPCLPDTHIMRHLYEVRAGLELQAIGRPARNGHRHDRLALQTLRNHWQALDDGKPPEPDPDIFLLDDSFNVGLARAAGNDFLADLLQQINERIRIIRMQDFLLAERIGLTIAEHLQIVELVLADDLVGAEAAFSAHLAASMAVVEERALVALARMARSNR